MIFVKFIGFGAEHDCVAIECDANFIAWIFLAGLRSYAEFRGGGASIDCCPYVDNFIRKEKIEFPRGNERAQRAAASEAAGLYAEPVFVDGIERSKGEVG